MQREWTNIDVLRMEKFLLLTRRYVGSMLKLCAEKWEEEVVGEMMGLLGEVPMEKEDPRVPNGLRYHVIDIYVDEMERAGALGEGAPLERLLMPLRVLAKESPTKPVRIKAKEALADERLPGNEKKDEPAVEDGWAGIED
jgi:ribosomal RNA-processing protein 1